MISAIIKARMGSHRLGEVSKFWASGAGIGEVSKFENEFKKYK